MLSLRTCLYFKTSSHYALVNILSVQNLGFFKHACTGEGPINVAGGQNRGQEIRVNGPIGAPGQMRMDVGFPMQQGPGNDFKHPSGRVLFDQYCCLRRVCVLMFKDGSYCYDYNDIYEVSVTSKQTGLKVKAVRRALL